MEELADRPIRAPRLTRAEFIQLLRQNLKVFSSKKCRDKKEDSKFKLTVAGKVTN